MGSVINGLKPIALSGFRGLYARGLTETCPQDHLQICNNCIFPGANQIDLRENFGVRYALTAGRHIISFFLASLSTGPAFLTLDNAGNFRDETNHPGVVLHAFAGSIDDFAAINTFGRCYISPKFQGTAAPGEFIYYYDNSVTSLTAAAGAAPVSAVTLAQAGSGNTDVGVHQVAVSFLYHTGYLSPPSPLANFNSNGAGLSVSAIPTGGLGVVGRVILMSLANQLTLFFIPGGTINDNVTTTFTINTYDVALISSADYLNRILTTIPSCSAIKFYSGRMCYIGQNSAPDQLLVSQVSLPENIDNVQGVVNLPVDYGVNTSNGGMIINNVLYVTKPSGTWGVQDNGLVPNSWNVISVDTGLGGYDTGISNFAAAMSGSDVLDTSLVCNFRGLMLFNGQYTDRPLSWKIETIWRLIQPYNMYRVQIAHNPWMKRVYISVPMLIPNSISTYPISNAGAGAIPQVLLVMDYQDGLTPETVKWSVWWSGVVTNFYKILMTPEIAITDLALNIASNSSNIYDLFERNGPGQPDPSNTPIDQSMTYAPVEFDEDIATFLMLNFDVTGVGLMAISLTNKQGDPTRLQALTGFNLSNYLAGQNLQRLINYTNEGMSVFTRCDQSIPGGLNGRIKMVALDVYGKPMWRMRPALTESA